MTELSPMNLEELLLPDPALMGAVEGDWRGLEDLQDAACRVIGEHVQRHGMDCRLASGEVA